VRVVALDLGRQRVGVAVSDSGGVMAVPSTTVARTGDEVRDRAKVVEEIRELGAERVVVGLPLSLDGSEGAAAAWSRAEAAALAAALPEIEVELFDERLTTVSAQRSLVAAGVKGKRRRGVVDQVAAAVLLQAWLDGGRGLDADRGLDGGRGTGIGG
jgi:putative holliday junction resolvase